MNAATEVIAAVGAHLNEVYPMLPFTPVRGSGVFLEDASGRRVLDFYGGHAVAALGYGHRDLSEALARQSRDLVFQTNALPLRIRDEAADRLAAFGPAGLGRVFFVNSGAEANENALRLAFRVTGRSKVIAMEHSFHGRTAAAAAVSFGAAKSWYGFPRTPFDVVFAPRNDGAALAAAVDSSTAAVIVEPVQGEGGVIPADPDFLAGLRALCDRNEALLIFDEVQCGLGRTGSLYAYHQYGVTPDILTLAKPLAAGLPLGAALLSEKVATLLRPGQHGSTFSGGPAACAVGVHVFDAISDPDLLTHVTARGRQLRAGLEVLAASRLIDGARGMGLMQALVVAPRWKSAIPKIIQGARERGLLVTRAGDDAVRLLPPLTCSAQEVDEALAILGETLVVAKIAATKGATPRVARNATRATNQRERMK